MKPRLETLDAAGKTTIWNISNKARPRVEWQLGTYGQEVYQFSIDDGKHELLILNPGMISSRAIQQGVISTAQKVSYLAGSPDSKIAASPDGRWFARIQNGDVSLFDRKNQSGGWKTIHENKSNIYWDSPEGITFSPDSSKLAAIEPDAGIIIRDFSTEQTLKIKLENWITRLEFSRNGKWLLAGNGYYGYLIDANTGRTLREYSGIGSTQFFLPNNEEMLTVDPYSGSLLRVDLDTGEKRYLSTSNMPFTASAMDPDGNLLVVSRGTGTDFIDVKTGIVVWHEADVLTEILFSADGSLMVTVDEAGRIKAWTMK